MSDIMVSFEKVIKRYGSRAALNELTLSVDKGSFFGYLGPNGAGKTTSIKTMIGLLKPDSGRVLIDGFDVSENPMTVRRMIGYVPDSPFIYGKLTAREFLRFVGGLYRMKPDDIDSRIEWISDIFEMKGWMDRKTEGYSHGMKQKVVMSAAFLHRPSLMIVDEPTVGLDPPSTKLLKDMLSLIQQHGTTVFMSSHDLTVVQELCERMAIVYKGAVVAEGTIEDLRGKAEMEGGKLEDLFLKLTEKSNRTVYLE